MVSLLKFKYLLCIEFFPISFNFERDNCYFICKLIFIFFLEWRYFCFKNCVGWNIRRLYFIILLLFLSLKKLQNLSEINEKKLRREIKFFFSSFLFAFLCFVMHTTTRLKYFNFLVSGKCGSIFCYFNSALYVSN